MKRLLLLLISVLLSQFYFFADTPLSYSILLEDTCIAELDFMTESGEWLFEN